MGLLLVVSHWMDIALKKYCNKGLLVLQIVLCCQVDKSGYFCAKKKKTQIEKERCLFVCLFVLNMCCLWQCYCSTPVSKETKEPSTLYQYRQ